MKIAFDLDNTLIRCGYDFPLHQENWLRRILGLERIREGTREVMTELQRDGWKTWIYTTSYRSHLYIRLLFGCYSIRINGVINQADHDSRMKGKPFRSSKYPPAFGIDLMIDDSEGLYREAQQYSFDMLVIRPADANWTSKVLAAAKKSRIVLV